MADDSRKIIIDEGWKAQVQREKEEAARKAAEAAPSAEAPAPEAAVAPAVDPEAGDEGEMGEAAEPTSFLGLVQSLATQCLLMLGLIAPQDSNQVMVDINAAKMIVDTLLMLRTKTEGNLTDDESAQLAEIVAELQHFYVMRAQQVQEQQLRQSGVDPANLKGEPQ